MRPVSRFHTLDPGSATVEATAWLREDLLAMIESLDGMVDDVRRRPGGSGVVLER